MAESERPIFSAFHLLKVPVHSFEPLICLDGAKPGAMADFAALRDAFPATPPAAIEDALRRHGNADGAASELLQVAAKPAAGRWRVRHSCSLRVPSAEECISSFRVHSVVCAEERGSTA